MTHADAELKRLQDAFINWAKHLDSDGYFGAKDAGELFFPFVAHVLNDPIHSAEKTALLNRFKHALGMELMAHELFGVTLEGKGSVK